MAELFGDLITIPDPVISGVFPLQADWDVVIIDGWEYATNQISLMCEQRILKNITGRSWKIGRQFQSDADRNSLVNFYLDHSSPGALFYFYDPIESGGTIDPTGASTTGRYVCRFAQDNLSVRMALALFYAGELEVIEVETDSSHTPTITWVSGLPTYDVSDYPSRKKMMDWLSLPRLAEYGSTAWTEHGSHVSICHYITIMPLAGNDIEGYTYSNIIRVADRRINIQATGDSLLSGIYFPRLLKWDIQSEIGASDSGTFVFANGDGVWDDYQKQVNIQRAYLRFNVLNGWEYQNLWAGEINDIETNRNDGTITIQASPLRSGLMINFPVHAVSSNCPLIYKGAICGSTSEDTSCAKTGADCTAKGNRGRFQGLEITPQPAYGKLNNSGFYGMLRKSFVTTSTAVKSLYGSVLALIYTNFRLILDAPIFEFRDESEFFTASGIIGEGPLGDDGAAIDSVIGDVLLDGMPQHKGYSPVKCKGGIPAESATIIDPTFQCAGLAFASLRRTDTVGITATEAHEMKVEILKGLRILQFLWHQDNTPYVTAQTEYTIPSWVAMDIALRALGLRLPNWPGIKTLMYYLFEMSSLKECRKYSLPWVNEMGFPNLPDDGYPLWEYTGRISEVKPAIDHIMETLANAPIDLVWSYGLMRFKFRRDEITAFSTDTQTTYEDGKSIIHGSFKCYSFVPEFNSLTVIFPDRGYDFTERSVTSYDEGAQLRSGWNNMPHVVNKTINLTGTCNLRQARALATQLLREELGGKTEAEQLAARKVEMDVPLVGLADLPGEVSLVIHPDLPGGQAYVRWRKWSYSDEMKIHLAGRTVVASMYDGSTDMGDSAMTGDPVAGIPGGSQGSDGSENELPTLTAPTLSILSSNYKGAIISMDSAVPEQCNYITLQSSTDNSFTSSTPTPVDIASATSFALFGSPGQTIYVRAAWKRSSLENGPWSSVVSVSLPQIAESDLGFTPGLMSRSTIELSVSSLAAGASATGTINLGKSFDLYCVVANYKSRFTLYVSDAKRTADAARLITVPPTEGTDHGVIVDLGLQNEAGYSLDWILSPKVQGSNMEATPSAAIPYRVTNLDSVAHDFTWTLTYLTTED